VSEIGYKLSSEEHGPNELVQYARLAEQAGFDFASISDHYHPWIDRQGHSPFVWAVLGGIARSTERILVGTGVTCPTIRTHPVVIAQAAATAGCMLSGRFFLGLGTGENLNEHIIGFRWPQAAVRREMLKEAVKVIRSLWEGGSKSHHGKHYAVENARIYDLPDKLPPIYIAASGEEAVELAGEVGDGLIALAPDEDILEKFDKAGGAGKPRLAEVQVCWARDESDALKTAKEWWPLPGVPGELNQELPLPRHFEQAAENVSESDLVDRIACGPDPERHLEFINKYVDVGYTHVWVHQVGPDQEGFFEFYEDQILPKLR
jgi:coenzyme F420-dependent glucose-6-phosphate dehydrogenase